MVNEKAELIQKKIEEGKLSINEARILMDLEPIETESCNYFFKKLESAK